MRRPFRTAEDLPSEQGYTYLQFSQDIKDTLEHIYTQRGAARKAKDVTAIICKVGNCEYSEVWLTESSRPYSLYAEYYPVILNGKRT